MKSSISALIEPLHRRLRSFAVALNKTIVVPLILIFVYIIGIGLTKILALFARSPFLQGVGLQSYWREIKIGFDPNHPDTIPDEKRYLRQS